MGDDAWQGNTLCVELLCMEASSEFRGSAWTRSGGDSLLGDVLHVDDLHGAVNERGSEFLDGFVWRKSSARRCPTWIRVLFVE